MLFWIYTGLIVLQAGYTMAENNLIPCGNATCVDGKQTCQKQLDDHLACQCEAGFIGRHCDEDQDECDGHFPCGHRGYCANTFGSFRCDCLSGWHGDHCQSRDHSVDVALCTEGWTGSRCTDFDECTALASSPCANGATCQNLPHGYNCSCTAGWQGQNCTEDVNECSITTTCQHGGTCFNTIGSYECICVRPWIGKNCDLAQCDSSPCANGATCYKLPHGYNCSCMAGWQGQNCTEDVNECIISNPCQHGGKCSNTIGSYECICGPPWIGTNCDSPPCDSSPCANGATCHNLPHGYNCSCTAEWQGNNCKDAAGGDQRAGDDTVVIVALAVAGSLLFTSILAGGILAWKATKKASKVLPSNEKKARQGRGNTADQNPA